MFIDTLLAAAGLAVGRHPKLSIFASLAVFIGFALLLKFSTVKYVLDFERGYTTNDAPSIRENRAQVEYFGNRGKPWYMALFAESRNGSMTNDKEFDEFRNFYNTSTTWTIAQSGDVNKTFMDFCAPTCGLNDVLFKTFDMSVFGMSWPVTNIFGFKSNIGKYFFKRQLDKYGNLKKANLTGLYYLVLVDNPEKAAALANYELTTGRMAIEHNKVKENKVDLVVHGAGSMAVEVKRGMIANAPFILTGVVLVISFAIVFLFISTWLLSRIHLSFIPVALAGLATPIFATVATFAVHVQLCDHLNVLQFLSPAFLFALGFDGVFFVYNAWLRQEEVSARESRTQEERASHAFLNAAGGFSIIILANIGTFAFGFFTPIPEIANLSVFLLFASIFIFAFVLFFFLPILVIFSHGPQATPLPVSETKLPPEHTSHTCDCYHHFFDSYSLTIANTCVRVLALLLFVTVGVLPMIYGVLEAKGNLDYRQLLPPDSPNIKGVSYMSDNVWPEFLQVLYIVEKPPNFADPKEYSQFYKMIGELEGMKNAIGPKTNMAWISDYRSHASIPVGAPALNLSSFKSFITHDIYKNWKSAVQFTLTNETLATPATPSDIVTGQLYDNGTILEKVDIRKMLYIISYNGTWTMAEKGELITRCREIVSRYPQFQTVPFDTEVSMIDVIQQNPIVTLHIFVVLVGLVFVLFLVLVANIATAVIATLSTATLIASVIGVITLWGVSLNPFVIGVFILSASASVRYTAHVCYHFIRGTVPKGSGHAGRLRYALENTSLSTLQSALVGAVLLIPLLFAPVPIFVDLGKVAFATLILGLLHSLLFVPALLVTLPKALLRKMCV